MQWWPWTGLNFDNFIHCIGTQSHGFIVHQGPSWSYGSWIYNYLCNQCLSPLKLWVWIPLRQGVLDTTLCNKVCQWLATGRMFSPSTPVSSTNKTDHHDITEILLKVAFNTINPNQSSYTTWFNHITTLYWNTSRVHHTSWTRLDLIILLHYKNTSRVHHTPWTRLDLIILLHCIGTLQGFIIHHGQDLI